MKVYLTYSFIILALSTSYYRSRPTILPAHTRATTSGMYLEDKARGVGRSDAFLNSVNTLSKSIDIDPDWIMAVMDMESGFKPKQKNMAGSGAVGLIQFTVPAVKDLNKRLGTFYYMKDIPKMSDIEQIYLTRSYLEMVFERHGRPESFADFYLAILFPKAMNQDPCYILFSKGTRRYKLNKGLDIDSDGYVNVSNVREYLARKYSKL